MTTNPMTEARLAEIEARAEKATEGPWRAVHRGVGRSAEDDGDGFLGLEVLGPPDDCQRGQFSRSADARFIAASRTDVPDLVAEVRRLRGLLQEALFFLEPDCGTDHQTDEHADLYRRIQAAIQ